MSNQPVNSKYEPLQHHLQALGGDNIPMTFGEIEAIVGTKLPPSARKHRPWWSNNPNNSVITYAWRNAGYKTAQVDMAGERLVFRKDEDAKLSTDEDDNAIQGFSEKGTISFSGEHPIFGCMKGTVTILPGVDLTEPADADWGKVYDN